jgi:hypothetical protein
VKRCKSFLVVATLLIATLILITSTAWANNGATIQVVNAEGLSGSSVDVPVQFDNSAGVGGGVIELAYDPAAVVPVKVIQNDDLPFAIEGDDDLEIVANLNYAPGKVKIAWVVNPRVGMPEEGLLCYVRFQINKLAGSLVSVTEMSLLDTEAAGLPSSNLDGYITTGDLLQVSYGDVNGDGESDYLDAILLLRYSAQLIELASNQVVSAKVNDDGGAIDYVDAILILRKSAGLIDKFPIEQ